MHPPLKKVYKRKFPFRLGTTSYIYPDGYVANIRLLGPYLDEIEVLLFESKTPDCFPSRADIKEMSRMAETNRLAYNVHLPLDLIPGDADPSVRRYAVKVLKQIFDLAAPLNPTTFTLHLPYTAKSRRIDDIKKWRDRIRQFLLEVTSTGIQSRLISIETLNYPINWIASIIREFDLMICLDTGHLMMQGLEIEPVFRQYQNDIAIMHLHGIKDGRDHVSLDHLSEKYTGLITGLLKEFTKSVSLEVFSYDHLVSSLRFLEKNAYN